MTRKKSGAKPVKTEALKPKKLSAEQTAKIKGGTYKLSQAWPKK